MGLPAGLPAGDVGYTGYPLVTAWCTGRTREAALVTQGTLLPLTLGSAGPSCAPGCAPGCVPGSGPCPAPQP